MPTPAAVVLTFQKRVDTSLALYKELVLAVSGKKRQNSLESMLAEQCVLGLTILWEAFIHDLMVAYIEDKPETCLRFHKDKITQSIESKNKIFLKWLEVRTPRTLTPTQIELIVDPTGWNITADSAESLAKKANQFLSAPYAIKFSLEETDRAFLNLLIGMRNYLSHRSTGSLSILRQRLRELAAADPTSPLNGTLTTSGSYLKRTTGPLAQDRSEQFGRWLTLLSSKLI